MKHLVLIVIVWACGNLSWVQAQSKVAHSIGLKSGLVGSRFIEKATKNDYWLSYSLGLSVEHQFTPRIALAYDLSYARQGNLTFFTNPGLFDRVRTKYDYITLPVSVRYRLKRYPIFMSPGFQVGYLIKNQTEFLPRNGYTNNDFPNLKKTDFGFSFGLGYRFGKRFLVEGKYYKSIKSLMKDYSGIDPSTGTFVRVPPVQRFNQVISATLTYYPFVK